eukprot:g31259.t1
MQLGRDCHVGLLDKRLEDSTKEDGHAGPRPPRWAETATLGLDHDAGPRPSCWAETTMLGRDHHAGPRPPCPGNVTPGSGRPSPPSGIQENHEWALMFAQ